VKINKTDKKRAFRMFAAGKTPEQIVEEFREPDASGKEKRITQAQAEHLYMKYIELQIGEKLRLTLMTECVSDRLHRLMDDISDLRRVDMLLDDSSEKVLGMLLDMKRKIKERMAKEFATGGRTGSGLSNEEINSGIDKICDQIYSREAAKAKVR